MAAKTIITPVKYKITVRDELGSTNEKCFRGFFSLIWIPPRHISKIANVPAIK